METENPGKLTSILQHSKPSLKNTKIEVWSVFIRLLHWAAVLTFSIAYFTGDGWRSIHVFAGYSLLLIVTIRVFWGFYGPERARFSAFIRSPRATAIYVRDVWQVREVRYIGHNPAGAVMVVALLFLLATASLSGVALTTDCFWGSDAMDALHETVSSMTAALIAIHVGGVIFTGLRHRENLVLSMITGLKRPPTNGDVD